MQKKVISNTTNEFEFIKGSDVQLKDINWFWRPYIAFGKIALLAGEPGAGKSTLGIAIAAQATVGNLPPDLIDGQLQMVRTVKPMTVAYLTTENTLGDMTHKDFLDNGGDPERILYLSEYASSFTISGENLIRTHEITGAQLIIIDPFQLFLPQDISISNRDQIRPVMAEIDRAARATGCAILLIHHLNKGTSNSSAELNRVQGSVAVVSAVRSLLFATRNGDTDERFIQAVKSNFREADYTKLQVIRDKHYTLRYEVCSEENDNTQDVKLISKRLQATNFLMNELSTGPKPYSDLLREMSKSNISASTLKRTGSDLLVQHHSDHGIDYWSLRT